VAKRVSLKGKGADLFFGSLAPDGTDDATAAVDSDQIPDSAPPPGPLELATPQSSGRTRRSSGGELAPASTQVDKTTNALVGKRVSSRVDETTQPLVVKYTTHLRPATIKALKRVAFESERKDYEIVQEALDAYLKRHSR
jgi:hypothetical protein